MSLSSEMRDHLTTQIIPFWKGIRDDVYGGYYGLLTNDLRLDREAEKGCILNSRILWFFSNAYMLLGDESVLEEAKHAYAFMKEHCLDREFGGILWSCDYKGAPLDTTKHTYNQAFAIYALSAYYAATGDLEALSEAKALVDIIETHCVDGIGYLEAFTRDFGPESNEKLSENGVMAEKTMNTLLHVLEAYTEFFRVTKKGFEIGSMEAGGMDTSADESLSADLRAAHDLTEKRLRFMLDILENKIYNPELHRQEVFFDSQYNSIIDLHSYGHDIETSWLCDRTLDVLADDSLTARIRPILMDLANRIYERAYVDNSLMNECERGIDNTTRVWWVQAETVLGFANAFARTGENRYYAGAHEVWDFIKAHMIDQRTGEWFYEVNKDWEPNPEKDIVEPWKCPYHNGRMCFEMIRRDIDAIR